MRTIRHAGNCGWLIIAVLLFIQCGVFRQDVDDPRCISLDEGELRITWRLQTQQNVYGFNVYRGEHEAGPWTVVNREIIPGHDTTSIPHTYYQIDSGLVLGKTYYYYIEEVTFDGNTNPITPVLSGVARVRKEPISLHDEE